jgi:hypothetical protein
MRQVQNKIQRISEEECLLPLSDGELTSIVGGSSPKPPCPNPLDERRRQLVGEKYCPKKPGRFIRKALSSWFSWF